MNKGRKYNSSKYLWDVDFMNDVDRLFIDSDNIKKIDRRENSIHNGLNQLQSMESEKNRLMDGIREIKKEISTMKREYRNLLKEGKRTIRMDLDVGDVIPMNHRMGQNKKGEVIALHFDKLGYVYGDIEIIGKTEKSIKLKYDSIKEEGYKGMSVIVTIEKTLNINNFKQIYLQLYNDEDLRLMVIDNTINEVLIEN